MGLTMFLLSLPGGSAARSLTHIVGDSSASTNFGSGGSARDGGGGGGGGGGRPPFRPEVPFIPGDGTPALGRRRGVDIGTIVMALYNALDRTRGRSHVPLFNGPHGPNGPTRPVVEGGRFNGHVLLPTFHIRRGGEERTTNGHKSDLHGMINWAANNLYEAQSRDRGQHGQHPPRG